MPVRVHIASRLRADAGSLGEQQAEAIAAALAAASQRALVRSRAEVLRPLGAGVQVRLNEPTLSWTGERAADVGPAARAAIEKALKAALSRAIKDARLPVAGAWQAGAGTRSLPGELFDFKRFDPLHGTYQMRSYDGGTAKVDVQPDPKATAAPDWDDVIRRLADPRALVRSWAIYGIHDLIEQGDEQAVRVAIYALRPGEDLLNDQILVSLRVLAKRNPKQFRALLAKLLEGYLPTVTSRFTRERAYIAFVAPAGSTVEAQRGLLQFLGALVTVAGAIPEAKPLAMEWEAKARGLTRTLALVGALAAARTALYDYLSSAAVWVIARALAGEASRKFAAFTGGLLEFVGAALVISSREEDGANFMYSLQKDLVENYRWMLATLAAVRQIDGVLDAYREFYGDALWDSEEGKALLEARLPYVTSLAENPLPTADRIAELRRKNDALAADWSGKAADAKYKKWDKILGELERGASELQPGPGWISEYYENWRRRVGVDLYDLETALQEARDMAHGPQRGPDYLAKISEIEGALPVTAVRVAYLQLWNAANSLDVLIAEKNPGKTQYIRDEWFSDLTRARIEFKDQMEKPDLAAANSKIESWRRHFEHMANEIGSKLRWEAFVRIVVVGTVVVLTAGAAAPEGAGIIAVSLTSAAIITGANLAVDIAFDKPISLGGVAIDFAKNAVFTGFLHFLNGKLFALALNYPGQTLARLAIVFGGSAVASTLPPILIERLQTGHWPDNLAIFLAANGLLNVVVGLIAGPKLIAALNALDQVQAEVRSLMMALAAEREAWLKDMDLMMKRGGPTPVEFAAAKSRGAKIYSTLEQLTRAMGNLPPAVLARMNLTPDLLRELRTRASQYATRIASQAYQAPAGRILPAPLEVYTTGLVPTGDNTIEYNPNVAGFEPPSVARRFRAEGYEVTETGGVVRLLGPGEKTPRFLLLPARGDLPAPALLRLVGSPTSYTARGLRVLQAQNAVPPLEATLTSIAVADDAVATAVLAGIGRHVSATDTAAIQGIARFLEVGGKPATLAVVLGAGERTSSVQVLTALAKLKALSAQQAAGLDIVIAQRGGGAAGTDTLVGIAARHAEPQLIFGALAEMEPYTTRGKGFDQLILQLGSDSPALRQEGLNALASAEALMQWGTPRLEFSRETVGGVTGLRARDASAVNAPSDAPPVDINALITDALGDLATEPSGPLDPSDFGPLARRVVGSLGEISLAEIPAERRAHYEAAYPGYVQRRTAEISQGIRPGRAIMRRDDYVRFRWGLKEGILIRGAGGPLDLRPGWVERGAGREHQKVIDLLMPGAKNNTEFPNPFGDPVIPDHLPAGSGQVLLDRNGYKAATGQRFSARFVGDSKYKEFIAVTDQLKGFVNLARFSDEQTLVLYIPWQDVFPKVETLTYDAGFLGMVLPVRPWNERLIAPGLREFATSRGVKIRLVTDPSWR
jgi:hypothetical protein